MKTLALVGLADSRDKVHDFDCEVWTLNNAEAYNIPRIGLLFDLHPRDKLIADERWELLKSRPRSYPVVLLHPEYTTEIPNSIAYPLEKISEEVFEHLWRGDEQVEHYSSTFDYMLAYAVCTQPDLEDVHVIGFEFGSDTEYRYQREGAMLIAGWAAGKGVNVHFLEGAPILPRTVYGYEDYQMISRQTLESYLNDISRQNSAALGRLNKWQARIGAEEYPEAQDETTKAFKEVYMSAGAMYLCDHLIKECDRRAPDKVKMNDPLFRTDKEGNVVESDGIKVIG